MNHIHKSNTHSFLLSTSFFISTLDVSAFLYHGISSRHRQFEAEPDKFHKSHLKYCRSPQLSVWMNDFIFFPWIKDNCRSLLCVRSESQIRMRILLILIFKNRVEITRAEWCFAPLNLRHTNGESSHLKRKLVIWIMSEIREFPTTNIVPINMTRAFVTLQSQITTEKSIKY